jgi:MerR family transcriptional regulator, thiopeptide resistance regulator
MGLKVSEVAKLSGVSVRTLHHYDQIGLLSPATRTGAGYRMYEQADLERLQQVLFFRELGFQLEEIRRMVRDKKYDVRAALRMQKQLLTEKSVRIHALIQAVEAALDAHETGTVMTKEEMFEVFGDFEPAKYEEEVKQRWGDTEAYKESAKRTKKYGKKEWAQIKAEGEEIGLAFAKLMEAGIKATDPRAMDIAEKHRRHIDRWFYPCSHQMHRGLGEMYVNDPRFAENIERIKPGLAQYWRDANAANADRNA